MRLMTRESKEESGSRLSFGLWLLAVAFFRAGTAGQSEIDRVLPRCEQR